MKTIIAAIWLAYNIEIVIADNLPPCPDDPKCPAIADNRWYHQYDPFDDPNAALQHVDQYDCSSLNLKKRGFNCFGILPKVLTKAQKEIIIQHGKSMGYFAEFLAQASDDRLRAINTEFDKYDKFLHKNYQKGSPDRYMFVTFYRGFRNPLVDDDETTLTFENIRDRALEKIKTAEKLSQDLNGDPSALALYLVPVPILNQMSQTSDQIKNQLPFPRLFFLNINDARKKVFFSTLVGDAMQYVNIIFIFSMSCFFVTMMTCP